MSAVTSAACGHTVCLRCGEPPPGVPLRWWPPAELVLAWSRTPGARPAPGAAIEVRWSMRGEVPGQLASFLVDVEDGLPRRVLPVCSAADPAPDLAVEAPVSVTVAVLAGLVPLWALYREAAVLGDLDALMCFAGVFESSGYLGAVAPLAEPATAFVHDRLAAERILGIAPSPAFLAEIGR